eukprot:m.226847 g.226847  ORF g.226847 m.226847 type:complete len:130 (-) comp54232_c0_seq1:47-436(-)
MAAGLLSANQTRQFRPPSDSTQHVSKLRGNIPLKYFFPTNENDPLLYFLEEDSDDKDTAALTEPVSLTNEVPVPADLLSVFHELKLEQASAQSTASSQPNRSIDPDGRDDEDEGEPGDDDEEEEDDDEQ